MEKSWDKQFLTNLRLYEGEDNRRERRVVACSAVGEETDETRLFETAWNALAHDYIQKACKHLERLVDVTESPIERAMLYALAIVGHDHAPNVRYRVGGSTFGDYDDGIDAIVIEPQAQLGEYRVDFLLECREWIPDFDHPRKLKDGQEIPGSMYATSKLIVECDGHDFHDRTKEQASRDRQRDRELAKLGLPVFRYTGADIWASVFSCAKEAIEHLASTVWNAIE